MHTLDQGLQLVYWAGQRKVSWCGSMAPIEIAAGALGNWPRLVVSPQHRMLIEGWRAEIYFGQRQVLSAAVHLAFEQHEIIFAKGISSESLYLGKMALNALSGDYRVEFEAVFAELPKPHAIS